MKGWKQLKWGDIATIEYGKGIRDYQNKVSGFRVFGTNGPVGFHESPLTKGPGVIIGRKGAYRGVHYSPTDFWVIDTAFYLKPKTEMNMRWAFYSLTLADINSLDSGSAIPSTSREDFYGIDVNFPPIEDQNKIASILSQIDEKIELNHQINETLESMAKIIFKEWFIDFGPVKTKAEGKKPFGIDDSTASLFPDSFEDSELGQIPKGWKIKTIGDSCDLLMGQSPPGDTYNENDNGMIFYQGRAEFGARFPTPRLNCTAPSRVVKSGTVLLSVRAPVGDLNISTNEQTCIGRGLAGVLHKTGGTTFTYYLLKSLKDKFDIYNGEGTVFGSINKDTLSSIKYVSPSDKILEKFLEQTQPMDELYLRNFEETNTLIKARNLLLPKLISGEISVNDV